RAASGMVGRGLGLVVLLLAACENSQPLLAPPGLATGDGLTPEQVRDVVDHHKSAVEYCYEKELQHKPALKGKVVVTWLIQPDGTTASVQILSSALKDAEVEDCLKRQIARWQFPAAPNQRPTTAQFPFVFPVNLRPQ